MLIAIMSDIHGNSTALELVLKEARVLKVEHLIILGDQIGYYYDSVGVYELLDTWSKNLILGNHEEMLMGLLDGTLDPQIIKRKYGSGLEMATNLLPKQRVDEIRAYKRTDNLKIDGVRIQMAHGTPWDTNEYVYPDASTELLGRCDQEESDFVFLGHTHYPFCYRGKNCFVVNPGAVGQSRVRGGVADWGVLNTRNRVYTPKQTPYDTDAIIRTVEQTDPDVPYLRDVLQRKIVK